MPESDRAAEQPPQEPDELQRDTADGDGTAAAGLTEAQQRTLLRLLRVAYPHPSFPDGPYERTADGGRRTPTARHRTLLADGPRRPRRRRPAATSPALDDDDAHRDARADRGRARSSGWSAAPTVVALYDDHEVWELLGYEGPSFDKGGYLDRGFDDLDWLPDPRVEEYDGEPRGRAGRRRRAGVSEDG